MTRAQSATASSYKSSRQKLVSERL